MNATRHFPPLPVVRHPVRWLVAVAVAFLVLVVTAPPAIAHAEHQPLPEGFAARITGIVDAAGDPAAAVAEQVTFTMAPDGARVTVAYEGEAELVVDGEQAGEPLLRIAGGRAAVNTASPQAVQVEGAQVPPGAAADLIDLVWDRAQPQWVGVDGPPVSFMDHRAVPGHAPVRADHDAGDVAATWQIPFTLDGAGYALAGEVVAVAVPGSGPDLVIVATVAGGLAIAVLALWALRRARAAMARPAPADVAPAADATDSELVAAG